MVKKCPGPSRTWLAWLEEEQGQDLIEYTLLLAFIMIASSALLVGVGDGGATIWHSTNSYMTNAAQRH